MTTPFASTPEPPYVAVIFSSQRTALDEEGYAQMALAMKALARRQPGYLGIESARGADGFGITASYWATDDDARAWKAIADHAEAQRRGRQEWYAAYEARIATVTRAYGHP